MSDHREPGVQRAQVAHAATGCRHWLPINGRFLRLNSGRELCPLCGAQWCVSTAEKRTLLGCTTPERNTANRPANVDSENG